MSLCHVSVIVTLQAKIGASVFDQLEKIAAHQQSSAFPSEVPTDSSSTMQGTMTVGSPMGAVGGVPQLGLNATQQVCLAYPLC